MGKIALITALALAAAGCGSVDTEVELKALGLIAMEKGVGIEELTSIEEGPNPRRKFRDILRVRYGMTEEEIDSEIEAASEFVESMLEDMK